MSLKTDTAATDVKAKEILRLESVMKDFGDVTAVDGVTFSVKQGEFFSLVGPSGCGKTTTLRMIAGFERPTEGNIYLGSEDVSHIPPYDRDLGMVFQGYALFPHKTVGENVGFGLKMQGVDVDERRSRTAKILDLVDLPGIEDRYPRELSGGQQQRVALARALVIEPSVLLLDEPLSNLDRKLREEMRLELKRIQDEVGITTIYVTHDQKEAMSMSDRVLVLNEGQTEQIDQPYKIYHRPCNQFVADFIGDVNTFPGEITSVADGEYRVTLESTGAGTVSVARSAAMSDFEVGDNVFLNLRPEDLTISTDRSSAEAFTGEVITQTFLGKRTNLLVKVGDTELTVETPGRTDQESIKNSDQVIVDWDSEKCILVSADDINVD